VISINSIIYYSTGTALLYYYYNIIATWQNSKKDLDSRRFSTVISARLIYIIYFYTIMFCSIIGRAADTAPNPKNSCVLTNDYCCRHYYGVSIIATIPLHRYYTFIIPCRYLPIVVFSPFDSGACEFTTVYIVQYYNDIILLYRGTHECA